jgi:hypothetical protein
MLFAPNGVSGVDDCHLSGANGTSCSEGPQLTTARKRRTYFANAKNRRQITFGPDVRLSLSQDTKSILTC